MYTSCYVLNFFVILNIFFSIQYLEARQSSEFDLKWGQGSCAVFLLSVWVCVLFHEWIPLPVFHASLCSGSRILEARWRHQSRIWNCSKYQALGRFVICYITYPANKVSLESAACFCCRMERNTPVLFTYCKIKCSLLLCPAWTWSSLLVKHWSCALLLPNWLVDQQKINNQYDLSG